MSASATQGGHNKLKNKNRRSSEESVQVNNPCSQSLVDHQVTGQLADTPTRGLPTRGLDKSRTGQLAVSQMPPKRKTKHAK